MYKVYLIQEEGTDNYKIGVTRRRVKDRISGLASGNSNRLLEVTHYETELGYKLETALHNYFKGLGKDSKDVDLLVRNLPLEFIDFDKTIFLDVCHKLNENLIFLKKNNSLCDSW